MKTNLSVNINKIALIRNSRGSDLPNLVKVALDCEEFGADGITVHPRPDQRHVRYDDIQLLKKTLKTEFNIEGYPNKEFIQLVLANVPDQVTLVPDPPGVLTSNKGWNIEKEGEFLSDVIHLFQEVGIRVSLFIEPNVKSVIDAKHVKADRVELYTGHFAKDYSFDSDKNAASVYNYSLASQKAKELGIGLNAGHDLNLENLKFFRQNVDDLIEVSIGHALITDALYYGLKNSILMYKNQLK